MTKRAFLDWLRPRCNITPVQGINTSGNAQKISHKEQYKYLEGPFGDIDLDDIYIIEFCNYMRLGEYPPGIGPKKPAVTARQIKSTLHKGTRGYQKRRPKK
jgi:hypothetical protein